MADGVPAWTRKRMAGLVGLWLAAGGSLGAQLSGQPEKTLSFAPVAALPGSSVALPVYLNGTLQREPRSLELRLDFDAGRLSFQRAERSFAAEMAGVELEALVDTGDRDGALRLRWEGMEAGREGIPEGLLGYIHFQVATDVPLETRIALSTSARAGFGDETPVPLSAEAALIVVGEPFLFSCFFYMH